MSQPPKPSPWSLATAYLTGMVNGMLKRVSRWPTSSCFSMEVCSKCPNKLPRKKLCVSCAKNEPCRDCKKKDEILSLVKRDLERENGVLKAKIALLEERIKGLEKKVSTPKMRVVADEEAGFKIVKSTRPNQKSNASSRFEHVLRNPPGWNPTHGSILKEENLETLRANMSKWKPCWFYDGKDGVLQRVRKLHTVENGILFPNETECNCVERHKALNLPEAIIKLAKRKGMTLEYRQAEFMIQQSCKTRQKQAFISLLALFGIEICQMEGCKSENAIIPNHWVEVTHKDERNNYLMCKLCWEEFDKAEVTNFRKIDHSGETLMRYLSTMAQSEHALHAETLLMKESERIYLTIVLDTIKLTKLADKIWPFKDSGLPKKTKEDSEKEGTKVG